MANKLTELQALIKAIEWLCLENEVAQVSLQETSSPQQKVSAYAALQRECKGELEGFRSHRPISEPSLVSSLDVLLQHPDALEALTQAIYKTQEQSYRRVEQARRTKRIS